MGRLNNIERNERLCHLCETGNIGDEFHYLLECSFFRDTRKQFLDKYYCNHANIIKFSKLMNMKKRPKLRKLCQFIRFILNRNVCPPG